MATDSGKAVAIVTGASSGIGRAIAEALGRAGDTVVISGRDGGRLAAAAGELSRATGAEVVPIVADAGDTAAMRKLVGAAVERFGRVDTLVNNAGLAEVRPIADTTDDAARTAFAANVFGPAAAIAAAWPTFVRQKRGCIVNISSWAAHDPFPGFFLYGATKSALSSLTRSCWNEGKDHGIRPFTIGPAAVETDLLRSAFDVSVLPKEACLAPADVAALVMECIQGQREEALGRCLYIRRDPESRAVRIVQEPDFPM